MNVKKELSNQSCPANPGEAEMNKARHVARLIEEIAQFAPTAASSVRNEQRIGALKNAQDVLKEICNELAGESVRKGFRL